MTPTLNRVEVLTLDVTVKAMKWCLDVKMMNCSPENLLAF